MTLHSTDFRYRHLRVLDIERLVDGFKFAIPLSKEIVFLILYSISYSIFYSIRSTALRYRIIRNFNIFYFFLLLVEIKFAGES